MRFSPFRRRRAGVAGHASGADAADLPWYSVDERGEAILPPSAHEIRVRVRDVGGLRALSMAGEGSVCTRLVVQVAVWRRPYTGWTGRVGPTPAVRRVTADWPEGGRGAVTLSLELWEPTDVGTVAAALLPLLVPLRSAPPSFVSASVSTTSSNLSTLSVLPGGGARRLVREPVPAILPGTDVLLADSQASDADALLTVAVGDVSSSATLDLTVHRPFLRRPPAPGRHSVEARLVRHGEQWVVESAQDASTILRLPAQRPLVEREVSRLRKTSDLDLSAITDDAIGPSLAARLVELAASGVLLHSAPAALAGRLESVASGLAGCGRGAPATALELTVRSVGQVRDAMRHHAGVFAIDGPLDRAGLPTSEPTVTALLVSRRPADALAALERLGAQTYRRLDVVLAMHGVPAPDLSRSSDRARALVTHVIEADAGEPFGAVLGRASAVASGALLTKVDDDDWYGPGHVWDLVLAYLWSGAQIVGKQPEYVHLEGRALTVHRRFGTEKYVRQVAGGTMLMSVADLVSVGGWRPVPRSVDKGLIARVQREGGLVYATRGPGFVYRRRGSGHTWSRDDDSFLSGALETWDGLPEDLLAG